MLNRLNRRDIHVDLAKPERWIGPLNINALIVAILILVMQLTEKKTKFFHGSGRMDFDKVDRFRRLDHGQFADT